MEYAHAPWAYSSDFPAKISQFKHFSKSSEELGENNATFRHFMRTFSVTFTLSLIGFSLLAAVLQFASNMHYLALSSKIIRDWSETRPRPSIADTDRILGETYRRMIAYDNLITHDQLYEGMVVNRNITGKPLDLCDSLLFSSLRYTALKKAGLAVRANEAWSAIQKSRDHEFWLRHPKCKKSTSRDMILGVMIALSQKPQGYPAYVQDLLATVKENHGYLAKGPVYVSYATPQISNGLKLLAEKTGVSSFDVPTHVRNGYSTGEFAVQLTDPGFAAHLIALSVWLELEVNRQYQLSGWSLDHENRTYLNSLANIFDHKEFKRYRLQWQTDRLLELDRKNLFFRYLRLKTTGAMNRTLAFALLDELLAMPQFPDGRLPNNCDRKADYLWQRTSKEYKRHSKQCDVIYSGTDFLWMAGILLDETRSTSLSMVH